MQNWINLKLGEHLCIFIFLHFPYSGLYLLTCVAVLWKERGRGSRAREKGEKRARGGVGNAGKDANVVFFVHIYQTDKEILIDKNSKQVNHNLNALMPFGPRLPEIFSLFVAHVFLVVGSCLSRPAVLQPRSILELFVPVNRFLFV